MKKRKILYLIFLSLITFIFLISCVTTQKPNTDLQSKIDKLTKDLNSCNAEVSSLQSKYGIDAQKFKQENERMANIENELKSGLADLIKSGEADIYQYEGIFVVNFSDRILFDPDSATLKTTFFPILSKLAAAFNKVPDRDIRIEGNTAANVPSKWPTSWDLGAARSVSIVRYLQEKAGIDAKRLRAVSLGEFSPVAPNDTEMNRAKNRRVDFLLVNKNLYDINKMQQVKIK